MSSSDNSESFSDEDICNNEPELQLNDDNQKEPELDDNEKTIQEDKPTKISNHHFTHSPNPPTVAWKRNIRDPSKSITQFQVSYSQMVKLVGLGIRMKNFVTKSRKEGKEPFMDPFYTTNVTTSRGVPCGGIGCGSISRSYTGEFNCFYLNPGRPHFGTVKANQFSIYLKREGLPSTSFVLGNPYTTTKKEDDTSSTIEMPPAEPLPSSIADKLQEQSPEIKRESKEEEHEEQQNNDEKTNQDQKKQNNMKIPKTVKKTYIRPEAALEDWNWKSIDGEYHGLFPRAWTKYDLKKIDKRLEITCKQISPVIPNNYEESSFPCTIFVWTITNTHPSKNIDVSLMFTFHNGTGEVNDYTGGHVNQPFRSNLENLEKKSNHDDQKKMNSTIGVELIHSRVKECIENGKSIHYQDPLSFGIATTNADKIHNDGSISSHSSQLSSATTFQTTGHGDLLWRSFSLTGKAILPEKSATSSIEGIGIGAAVANKVTVECNSTVEIAFSLAWDQPIIRFGEGRGVHPRYTKFYGISGNSVQKICHDSLSNWRKWDAEIDKWQEPILKNPDLPDWYKTALFNELYYIVAGGSLWIDQEESNASKLANQIVSTQIHRHERPHTLQEDKEFAKKIFEDFMTLTQNMENGIMIHHQFDESKSGRIIFSADEIQNDVLYLTDNGNTLIKNSEGIVTLADRITLFTNKDPNSPPITPVATSPRKNEKEEEQQQPSSNEPVIDEVNQSLFNFGEYGCYLYLEGQEYLMYNTYDVHFYASFALISLWPELELNLQRTMARAALIHSPKEQQVMLHSNEIRPKKLRGAVPHDIGTPSGDPLYSINSYCIHDVNDWKDLNSKFTLQVYRDYVATKNVKFLEEVYPVVWECMHYLER